MRDLKFRAWDKRNKRMIFLTATAFGDIMDNHDRSDWIIQQFTGLEDRKGQEIYEGDIVEYNGSSLFEVIWEVEDGCFFLDKITKDNIIHDIRMGRLDIRTKIIGNKYDNPELLDAEDMEDVQ